MLEKSTPETHHEVSGFTIEKTIKLMKLSFSRILLLHQEIDITVDQWVIIQLLFRHNKLNQQQLSELSFKDAPTMTRILDLLETKGILKRESDVSDRRKFIISLTDAGLKTYSMVIPLLKDFREEAYAGIPVDELYIMERTLNQIFENLSKHN